MIKRTKNSTLKPRGIRRKPRKRRKKTPLTIAREKLEEVQKQLTIKLYGRDCYTCPQLNLEGMNCQLGHVPWPRSELSLRCIFDVGFTRIQCFRCNINCGGNGAKALARMQREKIDVDKLELQNFVTKGKSTPLQWFYDKQKEYESLLSPLS